MTRFANEPSPPYIRSGRMHLFHDPACGGFGPKSRNHSSAAAVEAMSFVGSSTEDLPGLIGLEIVMIDWRLR